LIAKIFTQERINALIAALVLIGLALVIVGVWRYVDASQRLAGNYAQDIREGDISFNVENPEQAQGLIAADVQRRRLERQQNESLILAGVGLASLAVGWIGYDVIRGRRRAKSQPPASSPIEKGA
jgi:uncharacterized membrane protein YidH (DUF202 family)